MRFAVTATAAAVVLSGLVAASAPAAAAKEPWPDLLGTWVGQSRAIVTANSGHYGNAGAGSEPRFASVELVIEITKEDQGR